MAYTPCTKHENRLFNIQFGCLFCFKEQNQPKFETEAAAKAAAPTNFYVPNFDKKEKELKIGFVTGPNGWVIAVSVRWRYGQVFSINGQGAYMKEKGYVLTLKKPVPEPIYIDYSDLEPDFDNTYAEMAVNIVKYP